MSASSTLGAAVPAHAINGDHQGLNWGWWADNTSNTYPDWIQVDFGGSKTINEIDVFGLQQNYTNPVEPTLTSSYPTSFNMQRKICCNSVLHNVNLASGWPIMATVR
ncbi:MAG: discoidin domain-containing protein [Pyrinomonadaceae bacterium]